MFNQAEPTLIRHVALALQIEFEIEIESICSFWPASNHVVQLVIEVMGPLSSTQQVACFVRVRDINEASR